MPFDLTSQDELDGTTQALETPLLISPQVINDLALEYGVVKDSDYYVVGAHVVDVFDAIQTMVGGLSPLPSLSCCI